MSSPAVDERHVAAVQAGFYVTTGVWPLLHRRSFERLTGRKTDYWLAQTVGVLVTALGVGLAHAASREGRVPAELRSVARLSAAGLGFVDVLFVARRRISPIYLLDAGAEGLLLAGWFRAARREEGR